MNLPDDVTTLRGAAKKLGVRPGRLHELITRYPIPDYHIGEYRVISLADARKLVELHPGRVEHVKRFMPTEPVNINQAARILGVNKARVYRLAEAGRVPYQRIGSQYIMELDDVRRALEAFPSRAQAKGK